MHCILYNICFRGSFYPCVRGRGGTEPLSSFKKTLLKSPSPSFAALWEGDNCYPWTKCIKLIYHNTCTTLFCFILYYTILYDTIWYDTIGNYTILYYDIIYFTILHMHIFYFRDQLYKYSIFSTQVCMAKTTGRWRLLMLSWKRVRITGTTWWSNTTKKTRRKRYRSHVFLMTLLRHGHLEMTRFVLERTCTRCVSHLITRN